MLKLFNYILKYRLNSIYNKKLRYVRYHNLDSYIFDINLTSLYEDIHLGKGSSIYKYTTIAMAYRDGQHKPMLKVGSNTYIGEYNNIRIAGGEILIGNNCLISQHITMVTSNHLISKDQLIVNQKWTTHNNFIHISDDVWIGANSVILPGVSIGMGAVIAAGTVVSKDIPEYAIVAGNPMKILKYRK